MRWKQLRGRGSYHSRKTPSNGISVGCLQQQTRVGRSFDSINPHQIKIFGGSKKQCDTTRLGNSWKASHSLLTAGQYPKIYAVENGIADWTVCSLVVQLRRLLQLDISSSCIHADIYRRSLACQTIVKQALSKAYM